MATRPLIVDGLKEVIANGRSSSMHAISKSTDYTHTRIVGYAHSLEDATLWAAAPDMRDALASLLTTMSVTDEEGLLEYAEPVRLARAAISKAELKQ